MAEKTKNNNGLIIGVCCGAVAVVIAIVLLVIFVFKPGGISNSLSDDYFVSDNTKYVMTLDAGEGAYDEEEYAPLKSHMVYYYSGDSVTGLSVFYQYESDALAKTAYEHIDEGSKADAKELKLRGKYIEIVMNEDSFEGTSAEDVKQQIEFMEMLKNMDFNDGATDDVIDFSDEEEEIETEEYDEDN